MKRYFQEISALYHQGDSPGNIAYCRVLKDLLNQALKCFPGNFTQYNVVIDILEIPLELQIQMPCMRLWDGKKNIVPFGQILKDGATKIHKVTQRKKLKELCHLCVPLCIFVAAIKKIKEGEK